MKENKASSQKRIAATKTRQRSSSDKEHNTKDTNNGSNNSGNKNFA